MKEASKASDQFDAEVVRGAGMAEVMEAPYFVYEFECVGPDGVVKWRDTIKNLVTTEGKKDILDQYFGTGAAGTAPAAIYLGLISADSYTAVAVGDTAGGINGANGWKEANSSTFNPVYTGSRKAMIAAFSAASGTTTVTKSASAQAFAIVTTGGTVKGAFIIAGGSATTGNTTGKLYSAGTFTGGDKIVAALDTLNVTASVLLAA